MEHLKGERIKKSILAILSVLALIALDQFTKLLAVRSLSPAHGGSDRVLWEGVFRLHYLENRGAAFGILQGQKVFFVIITIVICLFICWAYLHLLPERRFLPLRILCVFVLAGAFGNFIDRVRLNYVVDFFYFEWIDFPVFNVADIYVTCAVFVFVILFLFYYKERDLERIWLGRRKKEEHGV